MLRSGDSNSVINSLGTLACVCWFPVGSLWGLLTQGTVTNKGNRHLQSTLCLHQLLPSTGSIYDSYNNRRGWRTVNMVYFACSKQKSLHCPLNNATSGLKIVQNQVSGFCFSVHSQIITNIIVFLLMCSPTLRFQSQPTL